MAQSSNSSTASRTGSSSQSQARIFSGPNGHSSPDGQVSLSPEHLPCPTGLLKDTSHVEILLLALLGHPRTLLGVAQHQEN